MRTGGGKWTSPVLSPPHLSSPVHFPPPLSSPVLSLHSGQVAQRGGKWAGERGMVGGGGGGQKGREVDRGVMQGRGVRDTVDPASKPHLEWCTLQKR